MSEDSNIFDDDSDELFFSEEDVEEETEPLDTWKVMVVDDDPEVHSVTKMVLSDIIYRGKGLSFISAESGERAKQLIHENPDTSYTAKPCN